MRVRARAFKTCNLYTYYVFDIFAYDESKKAKENEKEIHYKVG